MPPRHHYWTIILEGKPTAFRAHTQEELAPTLRQLQGRHPDAVMKWFARGRLWESQEAERADAFAKRRAPREARPRDWRPGGEHTDPRDRFKIPRDEKRRRFAEKLHRDRDWPRGEREARPPGDNQRPPSGRPPARRPSGRPAGPGGRPYTDRPRGDRPGAGRPVGGRPLGGRPPGGPPPGGRPPGGRPPEGRPPGGRLPEGRPQGGRRQEGRPPGARPHGGRPPGGRKPGGGGSGGGRGGGGNRGGGGRGR